MLALFNPSYPNAIVSWLPRIELRPPTCPKSQPNSDCKTLDQSVRLQPVSVIDDAIASNMHLFLQQAVISDLRSGALLCSWAQAFKTLSDPTVQYVSKSDFDASRSVGCFNISRHFRPGRLPVRLCDLSVLWEKGREPPHKQIPNLLIVQIIHICLIMFAYKCSICPSHKPCKMQFAWVEGHQ